MNKKVKKNICYKKFLVNIAEDIFIMTPCVCSK